MRIELCASLVMKEPDWRQVIVLPNLQPKLVSRVEPILLALLPVRFQDREDVDLGTI